MRTIQERPKTFNEITGHIVILNEFKKRSNNKDYPNYMLFTGASGTGKSTSAFIIAKLLNCEHPTGVDDHLEPCNTCKSCTDINNQTFRRDVHYLDATYMGKEEVGKLRNATNSKPMLDENKVFIIDEAHLLNSKEARGAMLTLTEKPRKNTYFILCTTDDSKFDRAFQSRFVKYIFKSVGQDDIAQYLFNVIEKEQLEVPDIFIEKGLFLIAENTDGSVRQGLQYLERCIQGEIFKPEDITKEFGFISSTQIFMMLEYLLTYDKKFFSLFDSFSDPAYVFNYMNSTLISTFKYQIDKDYIKNPRLKEGSDRLIKLYSEQLISLRKIFIDLNLKMTGYYFNKKLFSLLLTDYYLSKPLLNKREPSKRRRPVNA